MNIDIGNLCAVTSPDRFLLQFRVRHGLTRTRLARLIGVSSRKLTSLEQGAEPLDPMVRNKLLDLLHRLPEDLLAALSKSVVASTLPRALSRSSRLNLRAVSGPAIRKRPSIVHWIGEDLAPLASGVLEEMMADGELQRAILRREVVSVVTTTKSVLSTAESQAIGTYRTTINYFFHDGMLFSDALGLPVSVEERTGYTALYADELGCDLFGDGDMLMSMLSRQVPGISSDLDRG